MSERVPGPAEPSSPWSFSSASPRRVSTSFDPTYGPAGRGGGFATLQGLEPDRISETFHSRMPTPEEADELELPAGEPVVLLERRTYTAQETVTLPTEHRADVETLWNYHDLRHELKPCDVGVGLGSHDLGAATYATTKKLWPEIDVRCVSGPLPLDEYHGKRVNAVGHLSRAAVWHFRSARS